MTLVRFPVLVRPDPRSVCPTVRPVSGPADQRTVRSSDVEPRAGEHAYVLTSRSGAGVRGVAGARVIGPIQNLTSTLDRPRTRSRCRIRLGCCGPCAMGAAGTHVHAATLSELLVLRVFTWLNAIVALSPQHGLSLDRHHAAAGPPTAFPSTSGQAPVLVFSTGSTPSNLIVTLTRDGRGPSSTAGVRTVPHRIPDGRHRAISPVMALARRMAGLRREPARPPPVPPRPEHRPSPGTLPRHLVRAGGARLRHQPGPGRQPVAVRPAGVRRHRGPRPGADRSRPAERDRGPRPHRDAPGRRRRRHGPGVRRRSASRSRGSATSRGCAGSMPR